MNCLLLSLPICIEQPKLHDAIEAVVVVARQHDLSAYDATYLELAMRQGCPLATLDQRLLNASEAAGVEPVVG